MVGSVLMERMQAEGDFDLIEPVFFSTSERRRQGARRRRRTRRALQDALRHRRAEAAATIVITAQGGDYTSEVFPKLRAAGWNGHWIDAASTLRMKDDAVIVLDPVNLPVIKTRWRKGVQQLHRRQLHGELHADGRRRAVQGRPRRVDEHA